MSKVKVNTIIPRWWWGWWRGVKVDVLHFGPFKQPTNEPWKSSETEQKLSFSPLNVKSSCIQVF